MGVREWKMCVVVWCVCECVDVWRVCECVCVVNKDISQSAECFFYSFRFQSGRGGGGGREGGTCKNCHKRQSRHRGN